MRRLAPAKLNLDLHVDPPREDGFHPIRSHFVTIGLADTVHLELDLPTQDARLHFRCDVAELQGDDNLCVRAAELFDEHFGLPADHVALRLEKRIPVGGGLGGGSSDAAAVLRLLGDAAGVPVEKLRPLAEQLGSDVPFFLSGHRSALCTGRGEIVEPTPPPTQKYAVLLLPGIHVPTPAVYRGFDDLGGELPNMLQRAAFDLHPELADLHEVAERGFGMRWQMTGSGSTLFTLLDDPETAEQVVEAAPCEAVAVEVAPPF